MKNSFFIAILLCLLTKNLFADCNYDHFPDTQSIYDVYFDACDGWNTITAGGLIGDPKISLSRDVTLQADLLRIIVPNDLAQNATVNGQNYQLKIKILFDGNISSFITPGQILTYTDISVGDFPISFQVSYFENGIPEYTTIIHENFEVKQSENSFYYPDEIWQVSTESEFHIPGQNAYPSSGSRLSKYSQNSMGYANIYVKY